VLRSKRPPRFPPTPGGWVRSKGRKISEPEKRTGITVEELLEIARSIGVNVTPADEDDEIYQMGPRVRLRLPTAESLTGSPAVPDDTDPRDTP